MWLNGISPTNGGFHGISTEKMWFHGNLSYKKWWTCGDWTNKNRWSGMMAMNLWWFLWFLGVSARKRGIVMGFILWISLVSWHSYGIDDPFIEFSSNVYFFKILTQSPPGCQPFSLRGRRVQAPSDALSTMERVGPLIGWNQAKLKFLQMPPDQGCGGPRWGWDDLRWRCCTQQTANW